MKNNQDFEKAPEKMVLKELMELKEGESVQLLEIILKNGSSNGKLSFAISVGITEGYEMIVVPYIDMIVECIKASLKSYGIEKLLSMENQNVDIPFASIDLSMNENDANVGARFNLIDKLDLGDETHYDFYKKLNIVLGEVAHATTTLVNRYAELKDNGEIYSPRMFEFTFTQTNGEFVYDSFNRMADRPISQQKDEVFRLHDRGISKMLFDVVNKEQCNQYKYLVLRFYSDGLSISNVRVGSLDHIYLKHDTK